MKPILIRGLGAVSPAGWGVSALGDALRAKVPLPITNLARPGWETPLQVRAVPSPAERPAFLAHPRLRRASTLTQHAVAAALEALGPDAVRIQSGAFRLGLVVALMPGCVTYSRRFYEEVLKDPGVASPLLFPETVFNAPASHLAAFLNSTAVSYTLVGDESGFAQGLAIAAGWLGEEQVDGALVIGAEELDWIIADAAHLFQRRTIQTGGAGALYLRSSECDTTASDSASGEIALTQITDAFPFANRSQRASAARSMRAQLRSTSADLVSLGTQGLPQLDLAEQEAWRDWLGARLAPRELLGDAFTASAAWQCIAACAALEEGAFAGANVSLVGTNAQAIGVRFQRTP